MGTSSRRNAAKRQLAKQPRSFRPCLEQLESREMLSAADLTAWAGVGNTSSPNNYVVTSSTSAGGTIDGRRFGAGESTAYLADTVLSVAGGTLSATTSGGFSASGTLTFDASTNNTSVVDPVIYLGFFDKDAPASGAFGFSLADQTANSFRFRASAGTTQTTGNGTIVSEGTYTFNLNVNNAVAGAGKVRLQLLSGATTVADVNVTIPGGLPLAADSFGILQPLASTDDDATFSLSFSNVNYTGETQVTSAPPNAPSGLSATTISSSQINLAWTDNSTDETGFEIDRATDSGFTTGLVTTTVGANVINFSATGLAASTTYYFRVRATNSVGDSANTSTASATTSAALPAAPSGLGATAINSSQIDLAWTDNSSNETGFKVDRATNSTFTTGLVTTTVGANVINFSATGLAASTTYYFRVLATNAAGDSAFSNTASATTSAAVPAAPSGLGATAINSSQIDLAWTDNSSNETGFKVDRATNSTFTTGLVTNTVGANVVNYSATGLTANTTYYFRVRATNASGDSAFSNTANATTPVASSIFYISLTGSDANNGTTAGTAWATMDKALRTAPANSTVYIKAGTYTAKQQTLTNPGRTGLVTFKPATGETVTFKGVNTTAYQPIDWHLVTNARIEGINFVDAEVQIVDTANFEFVNNDMGTATRGSTLAVYGINGGLIQGNNFHGYQMDLAAILLRSYNTFALPGSQPRDHRADNVVIKGNTADMNFHAGDAIHIESGTNDVIDGNILKNVLTTSAAHGDSIQLVEVDTSTINANVMSGGRGIIVENQPGIAQIPGANHDLKFTNNVHYNGGDFSLRIQNAPNAIIVNNTFWGNGTSAGSGLDVSVGSTNVTVVNNILRTMNVNGTASITTRGDNLFSSTAFIYGTTLQSGAGEIVGTPTFVNLATGNLHLQSSSLGISTGRTAAYVPALDIEGLTRDSTPNMGAYELNS